VILKNIIKFVQ